MDPDRELDGWSYGDIPFPEKGQEGYVQHELNHVKAMGLSLSL
jgi:hypothetical protein